MDQKKMISALLRAHAAINWSFGALEMVARDPKNDSHIDLAYLGETVSDINIVLAEAYGIDDNGN